MAGSPLLLALDVGTTKVLALAASLEAKQPRLVAHGQAPCAALRRGVVVDLAGLTEAVGQAIAPVLAAIPGKPPGAWVGVTGAHFACCNLHGSTAVAPPAVTITQQEVDAALKDAGAGLSLPPDREVVHALPRSFAVDGHDGVRNPVGLSARALEVHTHVITGLTTLLDNLERGVTMAGITVEELVFEPLAAAAALLTPAERDIGCLLVDIGGGTTDFALFWEGAVCHSGSVPLGGTTITRDLAMALGTDLEEAERLKLHFGHCLCDELPEDEQVTYHPLEGGEEQVSRRYLAGVIAARLEETYTLLRAAVGKAEYGRHLAGGVVLTGGGSLLPGARTLAGRVLGRPARTAAVQGIAADPALLADPAWATGLGLLLYAASQQSLPTWRPSATLWERIKRFLRR